MATTEHAFDDFEFVFQNDKTRPLFLQHVTKEYNQENTNFVFVKH